MLLGSWYAWGWLCNWDSTRDRATVIAVAYALIFVGTLMDLRALGSYFFFFSKWSCVFTSCAEILPVGAMRFMRGVFRPQPDAYSAIGTSWVTPPIPMLLSSFAGFIILEVPKDMLELLRPLHDIIIQVDTNTTDGTQP